MTLVNTDFHGRENSRTRVSAVTKLLYHGFVITRLSGSNLLYVMAWHMLIFIRKLDVKGRKHGNRNRDLFVCQGTK